MTTTIDNDDLRALHALNAALDGIRMRARATPDPAMTAAASVLDEIIRAANNAHAADAECNICLGSGLLELPTAALGMPVSLDLREAICPVCRPWPLGFPGYRRNGEWVVPPYTAAEARTMREAEHA